MADTGEASPARPGRWREAAWAVALTSLAAIAAMLVARLGLIEPLELWAYDRLGAAVFDDLGEEKRVALVTIDERAIASLGWPPSDEQVAELLSRVLAAGPRAIGLDVYRDQPRPPGTERLASLLAGAPNVIATMFVADQSGSRVPPPAALAGTDRIGFADLPVDPDSLIRRGLLFRDDGKDTATSLALRTAVAYLARDGITPRPDPADPERLSLGRASYRPLESDDGGYARIDAGGYQYLLDYGRRGSRIPVVPIVDVLAGRADPALLRDRAVLIGAVAASTRDLFPAPRGAALRLDRRVIYGVELQAAAVAQILRQAHGETRPTRVFGPLAEAGWVAGLGVLGGIAGAILAGPAVLFIAFVVGIAAVAGMGAIALHAGWWLPVAAPMLGFLLAFGAVAGRRLAIEYRQKAELQRMFARFVDPGVAEFLWRQRAVFLSGGRPRPVRFEATVLMSDLAGFSTVSEKMDPADVMDWVGLYMDRMTDLVIDRGGMLERFAGDGLLAVFGGPADVTDDAASNNARHAVDCALAMRQAVAAINELYSARSWPELRVRVGIHSGPLVGGAVGSERRSQYTVLGDTPNVAARLEAVEKERVNFAGDDAGCRILISGATRALIGPGYACEKFADTTVRGRAEVIAIYRLPADLHP